MTAQEQITIEELHPSLREVVRQFRMKCKHEFIMQGTGRWEDDSGGKLYPEGVVFFDCNYEQSIRKVGSLKWQRGDFSRPPKFRVITRSLLSPKYNDHERQHAIDTKDPERALAEMLKHFTPFTLNEIARHSIERAQYQVRQWKEAKRFEVNDRFGISHNAIAKEVAALVAQGVQFTTPEFKLIAAEGLEMMKEYRARQNTSIANHFVKFDKSGLIQVLSPHGQSSYTAFEKLPEFIQEAIGMMKVLCKKGNNIVDYPSLPGIGLQVSDTTYWVHEQIPPTVGNGV